MYVYKFINKNNEIIYIGKAKSIKTRLSGHKHLSKECYEEIDHIEYSKLNNSDESGIYERYLINKYSPKYNNEFNNNSGFRFELPELLWEKHNGVIKIKEKPKQNKKENKEKQSRRLNEFEMCFDNVYILKDTFKFIKFFVESMIGEDVDISVTYDYGDMYENKGIKIVGEKDILGEINCIYFKKGKKYLDVNLQKINIVYLENILVRSSRLTIGSPQCVSLEFSFDRELCYKAIGIIKEFKEKEKFDLRGVRVDGEELFYYYGSNMADYVDFPTERIQEIRLKEKNRYDKKFKELMCEGGDLNEGI